MSKRLSYQRDTRSRLMGALITTTAFRSPNSTSGNAARWAQRQVERRTKLEHASISINERESEAARAALFQFISSQRGNAGFLRSTKSGELVSPSAAFSGAVSEIGTLFDDLEPNGPGKKVNLQ